MDLVHASVIFCNPPHYTIFTLSANQKGHLECGGQHFPSWVNTAKYIGTSWGASRGYIFQVFQAPMVYTQSQRGFSNLKLQDKEIYSKPEARWEPRHLWYLMLLTTTMSVHAEHRRNKLWNSSTGTPVESRLLSCGLSTAFEGWNVAIVLMSGEVNCSFANRYCRHQLRGIT